MLFAWLIADGDMHLNMVLLKTADMGDQTFRAVRVAPLYDTMRRGVKQVDGYVDLANAATEGRFAGGGWRGMVFGY